MAPGLPRFRYGNRARLCPNWDNAPLSIGAFSHIRLPTALSSNPCSNPLQRSLPPIPPVLRDCWPRLPRPRLRPQRMSLCGARATWARTWQRSATSAPCALTRAIGLADRRVDRESDRFDELPAPPVGAGVYDGAVAAIGTNAADAADTASAATPLPTGVATDRDLRSASVTIRMNKAECARLRERAAEAGLTVSAYLRSCALEAEALRAEVKQALAELKAGNKEAREQGSEGASKPTLTGSVA